MFFLFLLFLLCFFLVLYSNFLFVLAALNQTGEEGLAIMVAATEVLAAVAKIMAATANVMGCKG